MAEPEVTKTGARLRKALFRGKSHDFGPLRERFDDWHKKFRRKRHMRMGTLAEIGWFLSDWFGLILRNAVALLAIGIVGVILWNGGALLSLFVEGPAEAVGLLSDEKQDGARLRNLMIGLAALLGLPFVVIRAVIAERQTRTGEQGRDDSRFVQAVEQLGAEKTVKTVAGEGATRTVEEFDGKGTLKKRVVTPAEAQEQTDTNFEVRHGAVALLEKIARDSKADHWPVMEAFCAYLRNNGKPDAPTFEEREDGTAYDNDERWQALRAWVAAQPEPDSVRQAILNAIGRRPHRRVMRDERKPGLAPAFAPQQPLPLARCDLRRANLPGATLIGAHLTGARMEGADLTRARMEGAVLILARMEGAVLQEARADRAKLGGARMNGIDLEGASLMNANLGGAQLYGAYAARTRLNQAYLAGARLCRTDLALARMDGTDLFRADMTAAQVEYASFIEAKLSQVRGLTQGQLDQTFGVWDADAPVTALENDADRGWLVQKTLEKPDHWPTEPIPTAERYARWRDWAVSAGADDRLFPEE